MIQRTIMLISMPTPWQPLPHRLSHVLTCICRQCLDIPAGDYLCQLRAPLYDTLVLTVCLHPNDTLNAPDSMPLAHIKPAFHGVWQLSTFTVRAPLTRRSSRRSTPKPQVAETRPHVDTMTLFRSSTIHRFRQPLQTHLQGPQGSSCCDKPGDVALRGFRPF